MILSQLMDPGELTELTPERLRELLLKLDNEIKMGATAGEKILFSIQANLVGVRNDSPAGSNLEVVRETATAESDLRTETAKPYSAPVKKTK